MALVWSYGGTLLSSFGRVTQINDYLDMPERRGENILIPFRDGTRFAQKYYGERKMVFGMAIMAANATALESTMDALRAKLAPRTEQVLSCTREDTTIRTAMASVNAPLQVQRRGSKTALIVVEFELTSPFFRLSTAIADNSVTINASPKGMTVTNPGTAPESEATIILTGPLTNVVITNTTTGTILTYMGAIASPRVVTISRSSTGEYVATTDLGVNVLSNVSHSGSSALLTFNPGANTLSITSDVATTGVVRITFNAPFL